MTRSTIQPIVDLADATAAAPLASLDQVSQSISVSGLVLHSPLREEITLNNASLANPSPNPPSLGNYAYQAIAKQVHSLHKNRKVFLKTQDVEAIHQMRVSLRRLRVLITLFDSVIQFSPKFQAKSLRTMAQSLGAVRDRDILLESLQAYLPDRSSISSQLELDRSSQCQLTKLQNALNKQRKRAVKNAIVMAKAAFYQHADKHLYKWLESPQFRHLAHFPVPDFLPELLLPSWSALWCHPGWWVTLPDPHLADGQESQSLFATLHDLRKRIKGVRYQLESCAEFYPATIAAEIQRLKTLQDTLGKLQDLAVFQQFLRAAEHTKLPTQRVFTLERLRSQIEPDFCKTWATWLDLRADCCTADYRAYLREKIIAIKS
jgi:CHAD domain-containing protein